jgi:hypothetical protein
MMLDVGVVLDNLGIEYLEQGHELSGLCPMHEKRTGKIDRNPSWFINQDTGQHICFSCGYKGNLVRLVVDVKEFYLKNWGGIEEPDFDAARAWLDSVSDVSPEDMLRMLQELPGYVRQAPKPVHMSDARLAVFVEPPTEALESRKLTRAAAESYSILWDESEKRWVLPLRDPHFKRLMGWQEKGTLDRYFKNRPAGLQKSKTLFGIENQNESMVVVVESPLDCVRIASAGIPGAVAICGSSVSDEQIKLLRYSDKIVAAFDNPNLDAAGKKASAELRKLASQYGMNLYFFNYGESGKKDPGDMTDDEIKWGIDHAISSIYGESAYVQGDAKALSS